MMPLWQSILFLVVIPGISGSMIWILSQEYELIEQVIISVGVCSVSFLGLLLTIGTGVIAIGGDDDDGKAKKGPLITAWIISGILALFFSVSVHYIDFWGWLMTAFLWIGCFILGLGLSFLIFFLLDSVLKKNKLAKKMLP